MRTNIVINDELMNEALNLTEYTTKKAVVEEGLRLLVKLKKQEKIKSLRGKLKWERARMATGVHHPEILSG